MAERRESGIYLGNRELWKGMNRRLQFYACFNHTKKKLKFVIRKSTILTAGGITSYII